MTTDSTQPQFDMGPAPANGQGQSQGHRRRRRRRKNKSTQAGPQPAVVQQATPKVPPAARPAPSQQTAPPRKKKKIFQKTAAPAPQPGNNTGAPTKRKAAPRQKTPREFVGPMDHSYRAVNGNVADGPPSTVQLSRGGYSSQPVYSENYAPVAASVPVPEGATTRIFCFIEDLFFTAKIQETARKLGVKIEFVKADKETLARFTEAEENDRPKLLVFDLNNVNAKALTVIPKLKTKLKKATSIIGFLNHLQGDLKMKAMEAGCDTVMPRSAFSQSLPNLLRRYGMEDEDDSYPQPM